MKNINKKKLATIAVLLFAIIGIAGASVFSYFGTLETEVNTKQALRLDRHTFDEPVTEKFCAIGGDVIKTKHLLTNGGRLDANVSTCISGLPSGIAISYHYVNNTEFVFPINLSAGTDLDFQIWYALDMNLYGGTYLIKTYFMGNEA